MAVDAGDVRERLVSVHPSHVVSRSGRDIGLGLAHILQSRGRSNGAATVYDLVLSGGKVGREEEDDASVGGEIDEKRPTTASSGIEVKTDT